MFIIQVSDVFSVFLLFFNIIFLCVFSGRCPPSPLFAGKVCVFVVFFFVEAVLNSRVELMTLSFDKTTCFG